MLCAQTDSHTHTPSQPTKSRTFRIIEICERARFPGGVTKSVPACVRKELIQSYAVEKLGLARPPSERSIRKYFAAKELQTSRMWMHERLEEAFQNAFPGGFVDGHLTRKERDRRIVERLRQLFGRQVDLESDDSVLSPSPDTLQRFFAGRRAKTSSQSSKVE